jgi:hypothetical protein
MEREVLAQGSTEHSVPKCVQNGCDSSPIDAEELIMRIYKKKSHT